MIELNCKDSSVSMAQRVYARQIDLSFLKMKTPLTTLPPVISLLFYFLSYSVSWAVLAPWMTIFFIMFGYRLLTLAFYHWQAKRPELNIRSRVLAYLYLSGILLMAACFASMTVMLMPELDLKGQLLVLLAVIGIAVAAIPSMSYRMLPICSFITIMISPLMYMAYALVVPNTLAMIISLFIYMVFLVRVAVSFFRTTDEMLWLQEKAIDNQQALLLQKEKAIRANNAKSEFLSRMSHELRTPLNAVIGLNDLMRVDKIEPLTEKQSGRAVKINEAAQHLLNLMNDVLDLTRIETGDLEVCAEPVDAVAVVNDILVLLESKTYNRKIRLKFEQSAESLWLEGDTLRLKQVLFNLLDNAIKYNRKGGLVTVNIKLSGDGFWRISVFDTGFGLSNEDIGKLFVPFSRLGAELLGIDGTGIGLSYSKQLVELMHGKIGVDSEQGQGSCFWFELPMAQAPLPISDEAIERVSAETEIKRDVSMGTVVQSADEALLPGIHILLAEDNPVNQELVIDMLDRADYTIDVVNNGKAAIDACRSRQYDLVLMDCEMPIMDGVRATEIIRQQQNSVPIIALTAHAISGAREKCLNAGMNDFMSKPFITADIQSIVEKWTASAGSVTEVEEVPAAHFSPPLMMDETEQGGEVMAGSTQFESVIDMDVIGRLRQAHKKSTVSVKKKSPLLNRIVGLYFEQTPGLLEQLSAAVSQKNIEAIIDLSHTLKSSTAAVGAIKLAEVFKKIELSGRDGKLDLTEMQQMLSDIHHYYQEVTDSLNDILVGEG